MPDKIINSDGSVVPIVELNTGGSGVSDSTGAFRFDPSSTAHTYTYNDDDKVLTDSVTTGGNTFVKTYSYTGDVLMGETAWVKQ